MDVQLGDGPFPAGLERPEAPLTEDELAYLERTDNVLMTALESISRFRAGISANPPDTNRIADAVVFWQATLPGMLEAAPAGVLDGFYEQYVEVAALLAVVGTDVTAVINGDSARIDAVTRNLSAAEQQLANLRDAVAAYGSIQASDAVSSGGGSDAELSSAEEDYLRAAAELVSEFLQGAAAVRDELAEAEPDDSVIESAVRSWGSLADRADELTAPSDALAGFHTRFRDAFANLRGDPARLILVRIAAGELDAIAGPLEELEAPVLALQEELAGYLPG